MQKFYIIKNTGAWMMDELAAFAESTKFTIFFIRKQDPFYDDKIKLLEEKGINIIYLETRNSFSFSKLIFCFLFTIRHLNCFLNLHSLVYGIKSLGYFLRTDLKVFKNEQISLHCQFATQAAILGLMLKEYFGTNASYSLTFHAYDIYVRNLWFNSLAAGAERLFSINNYNIKYVFEHYDIKDKSKVIYSPLGVFPPPEIKSNKPSDVLRIGFLSYFVEMKGINFLLPAIKELKNSGFPFILNFAGDGPLKNEMVSFVGKNSLWENVKFHGLIKNEEKDLFFRNLDVFILPSISKGMETDGLPVVLMEAVSYGLPIISTNISGIPEICINDYNGYLIEQKSVDEIVNAIIKFSSDSSKWSLFSRNSLEISKQYNITTNSGEKLKMLGWE
jgi:colanic acid/amylovoran biosynthesis glycosyltransferase